ncbi:hypothetical protein EDD70_0099 [Hydrogenoanaerobacterium saccharovorans]|uniref:Uncharacterized protein n=1 Tax=Hydrogenoanaerobacterium saccharovorans TaxID=474960 RepID=A0A1H8BNF3_9FIRM|nr:hypothetical protein EDD70_0099 [Hydrogenoanaerobacterium saccharovorans]SEM84049.1 hypothetical protein SAMN05216180_1996 [Hydrogenoanaerobacterium saccharovorans]
MEKVSFHFRKLNLQRIVACKQELKHILVR